MTEEGRISGMTERAIEKEKYRRKS